VSRGPFEVHLQILQHLVDVVDQHESEVGANRGNPLTFAMDTCLRGTVSHEGRIAYAYLGASIVFQMAMNQI